MTNIITNLRQSFADADQTTRQQLAKQFEPLVNKIVSQQSKILRMDWQSLKSMGYEGLVIAMNTYDPARSNMTFTQFAAFSILNNIRNASCIECHTVKMTSYIQDKVRENAEAEMAGEDTVHVGIGSTTFTSTSISKVTNPNNDCEGGYNREMRYGIYESAKFADGDVFELLQASINDHCNKLDAYCFYSFFGLCGYEEKQVAELSVELGITRGRVSQRVKKVTDFIKQSPLLCESLASLLEK